MNGLHVVCNGKTKFSSLSASDAARISWSEKPYLGAPLLVYGHQDRHTHIVHANRVIFSPADEALRGSAVIDRILAPQPGGALLVRADGYPILLNASTKINFASPIASLADVHTNQWIAYRGKQRLDGIIVADEATLSPNLVNQRETHLRSKENYDPAGVPADAHQNTVARFIAGADPHQLPPTLDAVAQARVESIGRKLIPAYQHALADTDPTKIPFRFQVFEEKHTGHSLELPNGTILIPLSVVKRLQNDDQVASYLAADIATVLEKQQFRDARKKEAILATSLAGAALVPVTPFVNAAVVPITTATNFNMDDLMAAELAQQMRVALCLLHDAGYDLREAPRAWWLLESKEPQPLSKIEIPAVSIYTYAILGSTWRNTAWE